LIQKGGNIMVLQLNFNKPDNYAFFCPVSRLHLTRSNPVGKVNEVTRYIQRGLNSGKIIELKEENNDNVSDNNKKETEQEQLQKSTISSEVQMENPVESEVVEPKVEEAKEEAPTDENVKKENVQQETPTETSKKRGRQRKS
jgi:hypothetical protein